MPVMAVVGTINRFAPPGPDWTVIHCDLSDRGVWNIDRGVSMPVDHVCDMRHLPFADASIDRVQSWHALEHVNQQGGRDTIIEFRRVLMPGGILDLRVPNLGILAGPDIEKRLPLIYGEQGTMPDSHLNAHQWGYTRRSLQRLLDEHGFACEQWPHPEHDDELHVIARRP